MWAVDYTADADAVFAYNMNVDEDPIQDLTSNNRDGTLLAAGSPNFIASAKYDGGFDFIPDDRVSITDHADFTFVGLSSASMVLWDNPDHTNAGRHWLMTKGKASNYEWAVYTSSTLVKFEGWSLAGTQIVLFSGGPIASGTWYHVAITFDHPSSETYDMYLNGTDVGGKTDTSNGADGTSDVWLGGRADGGATYLDAQMDEPAFFKRHLSATEVNDIMDNKLEGSAAAARRVFVVARDNQPKRKDIRESY